MPRSAVMHPRAITPTTRANTRSKKRTGKESTGSGGTQPAAATATTSDALSSPSSVAEKGAQTGTHSVAATVSFATPERAVQQPEDADDMNHGPAAGQEAEAQIDASSPSDPAGSGRSTRPSSGRNTTTNTTTMKTTPVATPKAATVTPPEDKTGSSAGASAPSMASPPADPTSGNLSDPASSSASATPSPTGATQQQQTQTAAAVKLQPRKTPTPADVKMAASGASTTAAAGGTEVKTAAGSRSSPTLPQVKKEDSAAHAAGDDASDPGLSPGAKRFGLRKRKPKSAPLQQDIEEEEEKSGGATAAASTAAGGRASPRGPMAVPSKGPAAPPKSPKAATTSASSAAAAAAARNVTFSPVPPQVHYKKSPARSPTGNRKFQTLPNLTECHEPLTPSSQFLSPDSPKRRSSPPAGAKEGGGKGTSSSKEKGDREGRATTPTNFATDFGKALQSPSFQTGEGVFSWLQSPTGLFSPGGYMPSGPNTPHGYYGGGSVGPRTPRTPNDRAGFFFSDVAGLPRGEPFSPRMSGRRHPQHPLSNLICVSPLATNKASKPGTPINYKNIFDSPPGRHPGSRGAPYIGGKGKRKKGGAPTLEAVHMAERDLMEDEDLSVLLQLASTGQTPKGHPAHARYGGIAGEAPSNLQLPMIGKGGPSHPGGTPSSKLVARKDLPGGRHPQHRHMDDFRPPALPSRAGPGGGYAAAHAGTAAAGKKNTGAAAAGAKGAKGGKSTSRGKKTPSPTEGPPKLPVPGPPAMHPGQAGAEGAEHKKFNMPHPMGGPPPPHFMGHPPPGWKPGAGPPPPHGPHGGPPRGPPPYGIPPPASGPNGKGPPPPPGGPHGRPMYPHNFPPHMPYPMMHFPPQPHPRHPMNLYGQPPKSKSGNGNGNGKGNGDGNGNGNGNGPSKATASKPKPAAKTATKRKSTAGGLLGPVTTKKSKPSSPKKKTRKKASTNNQPGAGAGGLSPVDRQKAAKTIQAVNASAGGKNDKAAALAAAILRGVTMRPSGKWQAQLYFAGKSRYIGVFDTREKAALAYEIAREKLKDAKGSGDNTPSSLKATEDAVNAARKAAFDGVNEKDPRRK